MNELLKYVKDSYPEFARHVEIIIKYNYPWIWRDLVESLIPLSPEDAIKVAIHYKQENDEIHPPYLTLAGAYIKTGDMKLAMSTFEEAISKNVVGVTSIYDSYFDNVEKIYKPKAIIRAYDKLIKSKHHLPTHRKFIRYLLRMGKHKRCEKECFFVLDKYKVKAITVNIYLSDSYKARKKYHSAKKALLKVVESKPKNGEAWKRISEIEKLISLSPENIVRSIEFSPEHHASGISILQNFGKLLRDKYKDTPVKVTISQEDLKVKMIITPPDGKKLEVEEYLLNYGLVIKGEMEVEEFLHNPKEILELKTELMIAHNRIQIQREQMAFVDNQYSSRVMSLEKEVDWLREKVGEGLAIQKSSNNDLLTILESTNKDNKKIVGKIIKASDDKNMKKLEAAISSLKKNEPEAYTRLKDFIANTIAGAGAGAPSWIEFISKAVPT